MRVHSQRGFTLIELLIVMAIVAIIVAIVIPSLARDRWVKTTRAFERHFGVSIEPFVNFNIERKKWLTDDQRARLRPLVTKQIAAVCADPAGQLKEAQKNRQDFLASPPSTNPGEVAVQLSLLAEIDQQVALGQRIADEGAAACQGAKDAAEEFGLLLQ